MIPRKRLDISGWDLLYGLVHCGVPIPANRYQPDLEQAVAQNRTPVICLSVRSGFDALLGALNLPANSEVLISALTIRDMVRIIEAHNLVPVPLDLDMDRLAVQPETLRQAITPRSRILLVAHLFGSRMPLAPLIEIARQHNLLVLEDCAQAFTGDHWGDPESDVSLFSFGPIKTATALGGGILQFRDPQLADRVQQHQSQWPRQSRLTFGRRLVKYLGLVLLSRPWIYALLVQMCQWLGVDHDRWVSSLARGFAGDRFWPRLRQRPSAPLIALLHRRLRQWDRNAIRQRQLQAEAIIAQIPEISRPGHQAWDHTYWVFPIQHDRPQALMHHLWRCGFDATQGTSSMGAVLPIQDGQPSPVQVAQVVDQLLYLPVESCRSQRDQERLIRAIQQFQTEA